MESIGGAVALLVLGVLGVWLFSAAGGPPAAKPKPPGRSAARKFDFQGVWARHPLDAERGWCVATNGGVPVDRGDEVRVRRRDGSRSFETVRRVLLELHEPGGDVVGHLVEVEED